MCDAYRHHPKTTAGSIRAMNTLFQTVIEIVVANVWLLGGLLIALLILKQVKDDVRPIFVALVGPLTKNAATNALQWVNGILLAILSLLGALAEVSVTMKWVVVSILCKLAGPPIATIIALMNKSPINPPAPVTPPVKAPTAPPFPASS